MSELCSVPRASERFAQSNALDEDIARLKYVSVQYEVIHLNGYNNGMCNLSGSAE